MDKKQIAAVSVEAFSAHAKAYLALVEKESVAITSPSGVVIMTMGPLVDLRNLPPEGMVSVSAGGDQ